MATKLTDPHKEQIQNMCVDGTDDQAITSFFQDSYGICLSGEDISVIRVLNSRQKKLIRKWLKEKFTEQDIIKKFWDTYKILISQKHIAESKLKKSEKKTQEEKSNKAYKAASKSILGQEYRKARKKILNDPKFLKALKVFFKKWPYPKNDNETLKQMRNPKYLSDKRAFCEKWQLMRMPYKVNGEYELSLIKPYTLGTKENIDVIVESDGALIKTIHKQGAVTEEWGVNNAAYEITAMTEAVRAVGKIKLAMYGEIHPTRTNQGNKTDIDKAVNKFIELIKFDPKKAAIEKIIKQKFIKNNDEKKKQSFRDKFIKTLKERKLY